MRMLMKTGSYAVTHFAVAVGVAYAMTGDWRVALGIGLVEPAVQTVAYAFHEKIWERRAADDRDEEDGSGASEADALPA
jgi:uncharacterized membrane protein